MLFSITKQMENRANQTIKVCSKTQQTNPFKTFMRTDDIFPFFLPNCHNPNCSKEMNDVVGSNVYLLNGH